MILHMKINIAGWASYLIASSLTRGEHTHTHTHTCTKRKSTDQHWGWPTTTTTDQLTG